MAFLTRQALDWFTTLELFELERSDLLYKIADSHVLAICFNHDIVPTGRDIHEPRSKDVSTLSLPHEGKLESPLVRVSVQVGAQLCIDRISLVRDVDIEPRGNVSHVRL